MSRKTQDIDFVGDLSHKPTRVSTEGKRTSHGIEQRKLVRFSSRIEKLIQEGHLGRYVRRHTEERREAQQVDKGDQKRQRNVGRTTSRPVEGGGTTPPLEGEGRREAHEVQAILTRRSSLVITFDDRDVKHGMPNYDEPMVISVVVAEYRVERVLIDQGSLANIMYWSTYRKLRLPPSQLARCLGTLYSFAGEQVPVKGTIELETVFKEGSSIKCIPILYIMVDVGASYNILLGQPGLNKLGAIVSTLHLCMKFPVARRCYEDSLRVGSHPPKSTRSIVNILDLDLDPQCRYKHERPHPTEDLKEFQVGPLAMHKTKIGTTLNPKDEECLVSFLRRNNDIFAWTTNDMPGIDPEFMCHRLSVVPRAKPVAQKKRKQGDEK
ncbi:hypothetical protein CR513_22289, partial [Mucuna pruriens]